MGKHRDGKPASCACGRPPFKHDGTGCRMLQLRCWECGGLGHNRVDCTEPCYCCMSTEHTTVHCPGAVGTINDRDYVAEARAIPAEHSVDFIATMFRLFGLECEQVLQVVEERHQPSSATTAAQPTAAAVPSSSETATSFISSTRGVKRGEEEVANLDDGSSPKRPCQEELGAKTPDPVNQTVTSASSVSPANVAGSKLPVPTNSLDRIDRVIAQSELSCQEKTRIKPSVLAQLSAQVSRIKPTISTPTSEKKDNTGFTAPNSTKTKSAIPVK